MAQDFPQERSFLIFAALRRCWLAAAITAILGHYLPTAEAARITQDEKYRYIVSDGLPDHDTGTFPNRGNPNRISAQSYRFRVPLHPDISRRMTRLTNRTLFGVARNGIPFDPGTAEFYQNEPASGWNYEALSGRIDLGLDVQNAHVQPDGSYHYHGLPAALLTFAADGHSHLVGYAADGFPIFALRGYRDAADPAAGVIELRSGYRLKQGDRPSGPRGSYDGTFVQDYEYVPGAGELDECNGRLGMVPGYSEETYHYFLTRDFPFIPRCLKGAPDPSFVKSASPPGRAGPTGQGRPQTGGRDRREPPAEAVAACRGLSNGENCSFRAPRGTISGTCRALRNKSACVPAGHRPGPGDR